MSTNNCVKSTKIPPKWLNCPRKALRLIGNNFIAFKTPLSSKYNDQIPPASSFNPSMLLSSMRSYNAKLGLWIDLTNTAVNEYYEKTEIESQDISYLKLPCSGCPDTTQTSQFINICSDFISKHPTELVGIHCTHGFNRTGFLIVAYLIEKQSFTLEVAIGQFAQARPPGIYKFEYLQELFTRYGDPANVSMLPALPVWYYESYEVPKKEFMGGGGVKGMTQVIDKLKLVEIQRRCQEMCRRRKDSGFPGLQSVSMDVGNLDFLKQCPYKVSWKADSTRYMMLIDGENEVYFLDRENCVFHVSNIRFPRRKFVNEHVFGTLVDGEMVIDRVDGKAFPNYLIFDVVSFENQEIAKMSFDVRLLCISKELIEPRLKLDKNSESFSIKNKDFWDIQMSGKLLSEKFTKQLTHVSDGLVYQPIRSGYSVLKWKPQSLNTIDFKLVLGDGMAKGFLFVDHQKECFGEINVTTEVESLDGKIIECSFEGNEWRFMRERTDKSFPNSRETADRVWNSIRTPITQEKLLDFIDNNRYRLSGKRPPPDGIIRPNSKRAKM
uniref:mRNA-capping enzyme n=1 Tax=Strigamia maritima TaxID=126957 RepID=T1JE64_STRMM